MRRSILVALAVTLLASHDLTAAPHFRSPSIVCQLPGSRVARQPGLIDLNGDGRLDVVSGSSDGLCAFLQQPDGTFGPPIVSGAGLDLGVLAVAALDGDPAPDVAALQTSQVLNPPPDQVVSFLNVGGVLTPSAKPAVLPAFDYNGPVIADVTGDGRADVVVGDFDSSAVRIYHNDGSGGFDPPVVLPTSRPNPIAVLVDDFNFDGIADLYVVFSGGAEVWYGTGGGAFAAPTPEPAPAGGFPILLDAFDGLPGHDLIDAGDASIAFQSATGAGTFGPPLTVEPGLPAPLIGVGVGDLSGDGVNDLVAIDGGVIMEARAYVNHGDGTFTIGPDFVPGFFPLGMAFGDVNRDGKADVAIGGQGSGYASVHLSNGDGTFGSPSFVTVPAPSDLSLADMDGDGRPDVVALGFADSSVTVYHGNGDGSFGGAKKLKLPAAGQGFATGLVDGDAAPDALVPVLTGAVLVLLNDGAGALHVASTVPAAGQPHNLCVGDLNHDGHLDCVVPAFSTGTATVLLGDGAGGFTAAAPVVAPSGAVVSSVIAPFGNDPDPDLALSNGTQVLVYAGHGDGTFAASPLVLSVPAGAGRLVAGDADADGHMDLFVMPTSGMNVAYFHNDGAGGFDPRVDVPTRSEPNPSLASAPLPLNLVVRDFDGDGAPDLLVANNQRSTALLPGTTPGSWGTPIVLGGGNASGSLAAADLDGDGDLDAVVGGVGSSSRKRGSISTLLNLQNLVAVGPAPGPAPRAGISLSALSPNPTRGAFALRYRTAGGAKASAELVDVRGRRVAAFRDLPGGAGEHVVSLAPGARLAPGVYTISLSQGSGRAAAKLVVLP